MEAINHPGDSKNMSDQATTTEAPAKRKAKVSAPKGAGVFAATASATPAAPPAKAAAKTGLAAMLALVKGGGASEATKKSKRGTPELELPEEIIDELRVYIAADARVKAAEGDKKGVRAPIEGGLVEAFLRKIRDEGVFFKAVTIGNDVCKGGLLTMLIGRLTVERPSEGRDLETIDAELKELLGNDYDKYVKPGMELSIKPEALEGEAKTMVTLQLLQEKLGDDFGKLFNFGSFLDLHKMALGGDDTTEYLTKDYVSSADFAKKLEPAMKKGLLKHQYVTFRPSQAAIAAAGEDMARDAELLIAAKANAAGYAAGVKAQAAVQDGPLEA